MGRQAAYVLCLAAGLGLLIASAASAKPRAGETEVTVRPVADAKTFPLVIPLPPRWLNSPVTARDTTGRVYSPALVNSGDSEYYGVLLHDLRAGEELKMIAKKRRGGAPAQAQGPTARVNKSGDDLEVTLEGQPFATIRTNGGPKPYVWPVWGPGGVEITRNYPMKDVEGEDKDHPHHRGMWFTHGDVNGVDFWAEGDGKGKIVVRSVKTEEHPDCAIVKLADDWIAADGKKVCADEQTFVFWGMDDPRVIDVFLCIRASEGPLTFGDTKEGSFGIRVPKWMTVKAGTGNMVNSAGALDANVWGKRATWVDCWGTDGKQTSGVAIVEGPGNPRFPSYWHARDYGLFAANPFGIKDFAGEQAAQAPIAIKKGEKLELRYRVVLHSGDAGTAGIAPFADLTLQTPKR